MLLYDILYILLPPFCEGVGDDIKFPEVGTVKSQFTLVSRSCHGAFHNISKK